MANGPQGLRGPSEPRGPHHVAGIADAMFSMDQLSRLEDKAEHDQWFQARNAYADENRPIIRRQLNPLLISERFQELPEFWAVYVPRTHVAWNPDQIVRDARDRVQPQRVNTDFSIPGPEEIRRTKTPSREIPTTEAARKQLQLTVFGSADEAERHAQKIWREYWAAHLDKQFHEAQEAFRKNAVINVTRQVEFTLDHNNPAHVMQYELWRATQPAVLPSDIVVHEKHVTLDPVLLQLPHLERETPDATDTLVWTEPNRATWDLDRHTSVHEVDDEPWQVQAIGARTWAVTRQDGSHQQFWRNASGRPVAFDAKDAKGVIKSLPHGMNVVVGPIRPNTPEAETLQAEWERTRAHTKDILRHDSVNAWLLAEGDLGASLKTLQTTRPGWNNRIQAFRRDVIYLHTMVFPMDGLVASNPDRVDDAYEHLESTLKTEWPAGPDTDHLRSRTAFWRGRFGPLRQDSLGIFQYGRVADVAYADPNVEPVARLDGTGDWIAHQTPSHAYLFARLNAHGEIQHVDLPLYRDAEALRIRAVNQGGHFTIEHHPQVMARWKKLLEKNYPDLPEKCAELFARANTPAAVDTQRLRRVAQAADPKPVVPSPETPSPTLHVTPLGGNRHLVWRYPEDTTRKNPEPEFVVWHDGHLKNLSKKKEWQPKPEPGETMMAWDAIPAKRRPWIVTNPDGVLAAVETVRSQIPEAHVDATPLPSPYLVRALTERYGVRPEPLGSIKEALWAIHPTPNGDVMLSAREWAAHEKPGRAGEYEVYAVATPFRKPAASPQEGLGDIAEWPSVAAATRDLEAAHCAHQVHPAMPPEVSDWYQPRLPVDTIETPSVRWGPVEPFTALMRANRFHRSVALGDLIEIQEALGVNPAAQKMQRQIFAGGPVGMTATDFVPLRPELPKAAGVTWEEAEAQVHQFAKQWLSERPKLAEKLTHPAPTPRQQMVPAGVAVSL